MGIVAATLAAFWPTLSNDFIALGDDDAYVLSNPLIRTVDVGSVRQAFTTFH
ncbi:MAG: hypothetical protein HYZ04_05785, partial [Rhodospirillales bacterium]|nr:hypothetical protein [Rhodospirillales bacterium]